MDIPALAEEARASISSFCIFICGAECCKRGSLIIYDSVDAKKVSEGHADRLKSRHDGVAEFSVEGGCPHLSKHNSCQAYERRPKPCREFPLYVRGKSVIAAAWCPAVADGILDIFLKRLQDAGATVRKYP